jgi:DNA adenine methylase
VRLTTKAQRGDLVYCDPPYTHSQGILFGAQQFRLTELLNCIADCRRRGVLVALSIDGTKRSGERACDLLIPDDRFEREILVHCGRFMPAASGWAARPSNATWSPTGCC